MNVMAASVETNLATVRENKSDGVARISVKKEIDVIVKPEPHECIVCSLQSNETADIYATKTSISQTSLDIFLFKYTNVDLAELQNCPKHMCTSCLDLINILEQAESEYVRLKQAFEEIISKNPLFECHSHELELNRVKSETLSQEYNDIDHFDRDSEDEPLSVTKKKRKGKLSKKKKKQSATTKRKVNRGNESWECNICGMQSTSGGLAAATAHKIVKHSISEGNSILANVKKEDGSQSPSLNNGYDDSAESLFKMEMDEMDDDDSPDFLPDGGRVGDGGQKKAALDSAASGASKRKRRSAKTSHKCELCSAAYTSLARLRLHRAKHEDSKPPYICEVCGAHYKHKRACDIHVALHKGISDWKCDECNKLFPSKGALQRHNNIHTGKLNYQCDLCGKSFIHTSSFKMHKLSHSGVKPHECDVCGLALMTRSHLKRHKRVHSGEKRHECGVCGKRFSERYNLVAHSKSHDAPPAPAPDPSAPPPPRRRLFRCAYCPERFERRYMLERHCGVAHGRALERPPPTPRNTMSKLLKAQAQRRHTTATPAPPPPPTPKEEPAATASIPVSAWSNTYAADFGISRTDYSN